MKTIINTESGESIYVIYDEDTIKSLISDIIKNCSIRRNTESRINARTYSEAENKINSAIDWNGNKILQKKLFMILLIIGDMETLFHIHLHLICY